MSKLKVLSPLAAAGMHYGYNRPLDRFDFLSAPGGKIPDRLGRFALAPGELRRFANLTGVNVDGIGADSFSFGTKQLHPLGTLAMSKDNRLFRYASAGASDLVVGNIIQSAAPIPNHLANTPPVVAIGATSFSYTPGATAGAANLYAEGTLMVDTTPGNGYTYRISGHPAIVASTAFTLTLDADEAIQIALTASSRVGLHHNPYKTVIQSPTTATGLTAGGACAAITGNSVSENFGWIQTRGPFAALINGTPAVGTALIISGTTAGAVDVATFTTTVEISGRFIARMMQVGVSTKNNAVYLMLD
jgi:hypothetical protein